MGAIMDAVVRELIASGKSASCISGSAFQKDQTGRERVQS